MHPSRQALLGGGNNRNPPNSYGSPPHLRSQNPSYGSRQATFNYGGPGPDSGGAFGSSTNSIPLAGRGRWGQSRLNAGVDLNVSFADQGEEKRRENQMTESQKRQGWGERSGGAVFSAPDGNWRRTSKVGGGETAASGGDQGDIWGTIPTTKQVEEEDDSGWRNPVQTESGWGETNQAQDQSRHVPSPGGWGRNDNPQSDQQPATSSGWDVPPPTDPARPRSNASSSKSNKASARSQTQSQSQQPFPQHNFQPRSQLHSQTQAPRHQQIHQQQFYQQQPRSNQPYPEPAYVAPIRTESSGWYDYATPPPQLSGFSGLPAHNQSQSQPGVASGWGAPAPAPVPASTGLPSSRGSRAIEIKDPKQVIPSPSASGWNTPASNQYLNQDQTQTIQQSTQTQLPHIHAEPQGTASDWDTPTTNIQRWSKSVDQASASRAPGSEPEVDGMDVRGSDVGWGSGGSGKSDKDKDQDQNMGEAGDDGWGSNDKKEEKKEEGDGWGVTAITGGAEVQDDGWGKPVHVPDNGGWGVSSGGKVGQDDGWGRPNQASSHTNGGWGQPSTDHQSTGWGQPSTETQTTGWGTPAPPQRSTSGKSHADREREGASYPTRSPMDERQQLSPAAKGLIQRHLGGGGVGGVAGGRAASGGRKKPERPPPKTNPFDVAAGDIWSSLPAVDDDEVIKPPSDSESEPDSPTRKRTGSPKASMLPKPAEEDADIKSTAAEAADTPSRMSLASTDDNGSITVHPMQPSGYQADVSSKTGANAQWPASTADMLIDFDTPEETFSPPNQQQEQRQSYDHTTSPASMMTRSSTLIDMDDMLELKTPVTSPDRKWIGLDGQKDSNGLGHLAQGRSFQNALDLSQLSGMFEGGYPRHH